MDALPPDAALNIAERAAEARLVSRAFWRAASGPRALARCMLSVHGRAGALARAAAAGQEAVCREILRARPPDAAGNDETAALPAAARGGHEGVCGLLLGAGARVAGDKDAALEEAAARGHAGVARLLLARGARSVTGLGRAAAGGHADACRALAAGVAGAGAADVARGFACYMAVDGGHAAALRVLLFEWPGQTQSEPGFAGVLDNLLQMAAPAGGAECCSALVSAGACAGAHDSEALLAAGGAGHAAVCRVRPAEGPPEARARAEDCTEDVREWLRGMGLCAA